MYIINLPKLWSREIYHIVRRRGLEPPRYFLFSHKHLKLACLPIPPPALCLEFILYSNIVNLQFTQLIVPLLLE